MESTATDFGSHASLIEAASRKVRSLNHEELLAEGFIPKHGLYFPAIYYPPIPKFPAASADDIYDASYVYRGSNPLSLYVHVPFCPSHCLYCHWVVSVGDSSDVRDRYLSDVEREMEYYAKRLAMETVPITSVLIGGGTPSMLSPAQLERLLTSMRSRLNMEACRQITCELEPTTILGDEGLEKLHVLKRMGVERVSMGVQSFDDRVLRKMGRFHSAQNAIDAIRQIRKAGFDNLSIDLIYGYPGFTIEDWIETLDTALSLGVDAYQMYRLRIEPHGDKAAVLGRRFARSPEDFPSAETAYIMKQIGIMKAEEAGLEQVSRRVFAQGRANNSEYLQDHTDRLCDVLGLGVSSWSSVDGRYYLNTGDSIQDYHARIDRGGLPINRGRIRSDDDLRRWAVAVPIKHGGISRELFQQRTGVDLDSVFGPKMERLARYGLIEDDGTAIRLTEKGGFFADEVAIQFYQEQYVPFPREQYTDGALNPFS